MDERDIAKFAALVATGALTEDALLEQLGDDSIVSQIMAVSSATVITGAASGLIEDVVDTTFDVVDDLGLHPFNW
jgi:hypothetical protein